jgi:hypothetical protein
METFDCENCGHEFKKKYHLKRHLNNIISCNQKQVNNILIKDNDNKNKYTCTYCYKNFTRSDSLFKHLIDRCKIKKAKEEKEKEEKEEIEKKEKEERLEKERKEKEERLEKERKEKEEQLMKEREIIFRLLIEKDNKIEKLIEHHNEIIKQKDEQIIKIVEDNSKKNDEIFKSLSNRKALNSHNNTNTTNSNNTNGNNNNNTVNIQITQFGKEQFDIIDDKHFKKIVKDPRILGLRVPEEILKIIHFNPDYPQFNNFYVSDFNREKVMVHDGNTWNLGTLKYIKDALDHVVTYGKTKLEEYEEKPNLTVEGINRLKRIDDAIKKCDEDYIEELKEKANQVEHNKHLLDKIKDCEDFVKSTKENIKNIAYNKGKAIKSKK